MNQQSSEALQKTISILREVAQRLESGDIIERPKSFDELAELCKAQARKDHQHQVLCEYQEAIRQQVEEVTERTGINFDHQYFSENYKRKKRPNPYITRKVFTEPCNDYRDSGMVYWDDKVNMDVCICGFSRDRHRAVRDFAPNECRSCGKPSYGNKFCADCEAMGWFARSQQRGE